MHILAFGPIGLEAFGVSNHLGLLVFVEHVQALKVGLVPFY